MGAAAIPVVASVITSVIVSKISTAVASKIGLSDSMAGLVGLAAGVGVGGLAMNAASTAASGAATGASGAGAMDAAVAAGNAGPSAATLSKAGLDLSQANLALGDPGGNTLSLASSNTTGAANTVAGPTAIPSIDGGSVMTNSPKAGGMLTQGSGGIDAPVIGGGNTTAALASGNNIEKVTSGDKGWWGKLFSPENTMMLAIAGMGGMGKAGIAKETMEYDESVAKDNAKDWAAGDPGTGGFSKLNPSFPSQTRG